MLNVSNNIWLMVVALLLVSCATATRQTDQLVRKHPDLPIQSQIAQVPFIKQEKNHCGPATMAMVMSYTGNKTPLETLTWQMYTKGMEGTFQSEMLSSARRNGMLAIPVSDLHSLLQEVSAAHPVIVFQNLYFSFYPKWHYAVVVGYDLKGPDIILHSGPDKFEKYDMRIFERSWSLAGFWGLLVLRPDQLSVTASETTHAAAAAALEQIGKTDEAQVAYQSILSRWPQSLSALIGLGNVYYTKKEFKSSVSSLQLATKYHPQSATAWHNLAFAQLAAGNSKAAMTSAKKALTLEPKLKISLKEILER